MTSDRSEPEGSGSDEAIVDDAVIEDAVVEDAVVEDAVTGAEPTTRAEPTATLAPRTPDSGLWNSGIPGPALPAPDYSDTGVPSLDYVRDKIEGRYAHSLGSSELAHETPEARSFEEQAAKREEAARDKLAAIRRSLRGDSS